MLSNEIPGILPVNPEGGKIARASAVSPLIEAGNIYLPHPLYAAWVNDFIEECAAFPNGAHDDQLDAMKEALLRWNLVPEQVVLHRGTLFRYIISYCVGASAVENDSCMRMDVQITTSACTPRRSCAPMVLGSDLCDASLRVAMVRLFTFSHLGRSS